MSKQLFWTRRAGFDRRIFNTDPDMDFRGTERRSSNSRDYVLVLGKTGIDALGLTIALPVIALIAVAVTSNFIA
jgi:hypothetical protein